MSIVALGSVSTVVAAAVAVAATFSSVMIPGLLSLVAFGSVVILDLSRLNFGLGLSLVDFGRAAAVWLVLLSTPPPSPVSLAVGHHLHRDRRSLPCSWLWSPRS